MSMDNVNQEKYLDQLVQNVGINPTTGLLNPVTSDEGDVGAGLLALQGWAYDPACADIGSAMGAGTVYLMKVRISAAKTLSGLAFFVTSASTGGSAGEFLIGLYSAAGSLLLSRSDATVFNAFQTSGASRVAFGSSYAHVGGLGSYVYTAVLRKAGAVATAAQLAHGCLLDRFNMGLTAPTMRAGRLIDTSRATLPASINFATDVEIVGVPFWAGLT